MHLASRRQATLRFRVKTPFTVKQNLKAKVQKSWKASGSESTCSLMPGSARFTWLTVVAFRASSPVHYK